MLEDSGNSECVKIEDEIKNKQKQLWRLTDVNKLEVQLLTNKQSILISNAYKRQEISKNNKEEEKL